LDDAAARGAFQVNNGGFVLFDDHGHEHDAGIGCAPFHLVCSGRQGDRGGILVEGAAPIVHSPHEFFVGIIF
jgi:hypothetical protein